MGKNRIQVAITIFLFQSVLADNLGAGITTKLYFQDSNYTKEYELHPRNSTSEQPLRVFNYTEFKGNKTEGITSSNITYTNFTVLFETIDSIPKYGTEIIVTRRDDGSVPYLTNIIDASMENFIHSPVKMKVAYIPYPLNVTTVEMHPAITYGHKTSLIDECGNVEHLKLCKHFHNMPITFKPDGSSEIKIKLETNITLPKLLLVDLIYCESTINCSSGTCSNKNNVVKNISKSWPNISQAIRFQNLTPSNYCARISIGTSKCCPVCTNSLSLFDPTSLIVKTNIGYTSLFHILLAAIIVTLLIFIAMKFLQDLRQDKVPIRNRSVIKRVIYVKNQNQNFEILLLYPNESRELFNVMETFRNVLQIYFYKVWDMYDENNIEDVHENWWFWIENKLKKKNLKIIIVETKKTNDWINNDFNSELISNTINERIFYFALTRIQKDQHLCRDYRKLFRTRFETNVEFEEKLNSIVPLTCYEMPQHLAQLIAEISGETELRLENESTRCKLSEFEEAINEFNNA